MSNYGRDSAKKQGEASARVGVSILGSLALLAIGKTVGNNKTNKMRDQIQAYDRAIADYDRKISDLKSGLLGPLINSDRIDDLQNKRNALMCDRDELVKEYDKR